MPHKENDKNNNQNLDLDNIDKQKTHINESLQNDDSINNATENQMQGNIMPSDVSVIPLDAIQKNGKTKAKKRSNKIMLHLVLVCLVILGSLAGIYLYGFLQNEKYLEVIDKETFYNGIYIDNIHVGGLSMQQAYEKIFANQVTLEHDIKVTVTWDEEEYIFTSDDVDISYDTQDVIDEAYLIGRAGDNAQRYEIVMDLQVNHVQFSTTREIDPSAIENDVKEIATSKEMIVSEPAVEFIPDKDTPEEEWFLYSDPIVGIQTDPDALWMSVSSKFIDQSFGVVPVPKWEILPDEDIDFREITQLIVSFKTVQSRNSNREHNIALACSMINGTILMPGEEFSMNNTTGERTASAGYKEANTIVGGNELVPGIAGGVCQVSGTLFNAALLADLEITERYHHSFELGYLSRGRDATVNYGTADLKFVNNQDYPIYISMYTDGLDVYAQIYGAPLENCDYITIWVKTIKTTPIGDPIYVKDSEVPAGSDPVYLKGHQGITCEVYKIYKDENDETISSVLAYTDVYRYYAPELHVNPADYEGYKNPTPEPTEETTPDPSVEPTYTPEVTPEPTPEPTPDGGLG